MAQIYSFVDKLRPALASARAYWRERRAAALRDEAEEQERKRKRLAAWGRRPWWYHWLLFCRCPGYQDQWEDLVFFVRHGPQARLFEAAQQLRTAARLERALETTAACGGNCILLDDDIVECLHPVAALLDGKRRS